LVRFKKQPETPEEVERAVMACYVSCVRGVRYAGKDPKILKRFLELGGLEACDVLSPAGNKALANLAGKTGSDFLIGPIQEPFASQEKN
jgi:hypothetical protein